MPELRQKQALSLLAKTKETDVPNSLAPAIEWPPFMEPQRAVQPMLTKQKAAFGRQCDQRPCA